MAKIDPRRINCLLNLLKVIMIFPILRTRIKIRYDRFNKSDIPIENTIRIS